MSVTVLTTVKRRRDTTEAWEYINPILADREQGFETDSYGSPVGMKMGDGVSHWDDLPYWFNNSFGIPPETIKFNKGETMPGIIDMLSRPQFGKHPTRFAEINFYNDDGTQNFSILVLSPNMMLNCHYNDGVMTTLNSIYVYGNPDGSGNFNEDVYVTLKV